MSNYIPGIDVSHFQGSVDWNKVKNAGIAYAFVKATDGTSFIDSTFKTNWAAIQNAGLIRGAYHFFRANEDAKAQANLFLQTTEIGQGDLVPVIDVEISSDADNATLINGVQTWLDTIEAQIGAKPMIYTLASFWNAHLNNSFGSYPLWIANYGVSSPKIPAGWSDWNFWQYSQSGTIAGVTGNVDQNNFNGTLDDLNTFVIGQSPSNTNATYDSDTNATTDTSSSNGSSADGSGGGYTYIVKSGDTLDSIAASFQVSVSDLQTLNRIKDPNDISVGQILTIPI